MSQAKVSKDGKFTTIKVREELRRWLKVRAASEGVPMYELVEKIIAKGAKGRPWEQEGASVN
jgi:hypothetical protein